jgi:hypothetical protein
MGRYSQDSILVHASGEEFTHERGDFIAVRFQGEMPGVEQVKLQRR